MEQNFTLEELQNMRTSQLAEIAHRMHISRNYRNVARIRNKAALAQAIFTNDFSEKLRQRHINQEIIRQNYDPKEMYSEIELRQMNIRMIKNIMRSRGLRLKFGVNSLPYRKRQMINILIETNKNC